MPLVEQDLKALLPIPFVSGFSYCSSYSFVYIVCFLLLYLYWLSYRMWLLVAHVSTSDFHYAYLVLIFTYYLVRILYFVVTCIPIRLHQSNQAHSTTCLAFIDCKYQVPYCIPCCNIQNMNMYVQWLFLHSVI